MCRMYIYGMGGVGYAGSVSVGRVRGNADERRDGFLLGNPSSGEHAPQSNKQSRRTDENSFARRERGKNFYVPGSGRPSTQEIISYQFGTNHSDRSHRLREAYKAHFPFSFYGM